MSFKSKHLDDNENKIKLKIENLKNDLKDIKNEINKVDLEIKELNVEKEFLDEKQFNLNDKILAKEEELNEIINFQFRSNSQESNSKHVKEEENNYQNEFQFNSNLTNHQFAEIFIENKDSIFIEATLNYISKYKLSDNKTTKNENEHDYSFNLNNINLEYQGVQLPIRIINESYTFADLLVDGCRYFNLNNEHFRIFLNDNQINLTNSVKLYLNYIKNTLKMIPNLQLKQFFNETNELQIKEKENNEIHNKVISDDITNIELLKNIENIEDQFLIKIRSILVYTIFLSLIFVYVMSQFKVESISNVKNAFRNIIHKTYYLNNIFGLSNEFKNIYSLYSFEMWLKNSLPIYFSNNNSKFY